MAGFLKVLLNNLLEGPSTDPYPVGETFTPKRVRGRCIVDPELCVGCGMCRYACAAGAINIDKKPDTVALPLPSGVIPAVFAPPAATFAPQAP